MNNSTPPDSTMSAINPTTMSATNPQPNCRLVRIPLELFESIIKLLSTEDLGRLRLTCRALERGLFNYFSREFFRKKQFMAHSISLDALVDISKNHDLSPVLKHVIIATDRYSRDRPQPSLNGDAEKLKAFNEACNEHEYLFATGLLRDKLAEGFRNLPNLEIIDIRDFNSPTRNRDGRQQNDSAPEWWTSYGSTTLARTIGFRPWFEGTMRSGREQDYRKALFSATMAALAAAEARPKSIEVITRTVGLSDAAFLIPPSLKPSLTQVLKGITKLLLVIGGSHREEPWNFRYLKAFLHLTPELTWLRLNLSSYHPTPHNEGDEAAKFFNWLAGTTDSSTTDVDDDSSTCPIFPLQTFELGQMNISSAPLSRVIERYAPTLQNISFRRITMKASPEEIDEKANTWKRFFAHLSKVPHLEIHKLSLTWLRLNQLNVFFTPSADPTTASPVSPKPSGDSTKAIPALQLSERTYHREVKKTQTQSQIKIETRPLNEVCAEIGIKWPVETDSEGMGSSSEGEDEDMVD